MHRQVFDTVRSLSFEEHLPLDWFLGSSCASKKKTPPGTSDPKWPSQNEKHRKKHNISQADMDQVQVSTECLSARMADILRTNLAVHQKEKRPDQNTHFVVDISQRIDRARVGAGYSTLVTPSNVLYSTFLQGKLDGWNGMHLQGIFERDFPGWENASEATLGSLGGNAFSATVVMAVLLAVLVHVEL